MSQIPKSPNPEIPRAFWALAICVVLLGCVRAAASAEVRTEKSAASGSARGENADADRSEIEAERDRQFRAGLCLIGRLRFRASDLTKGQRAFLRKLVARHKVKLDRGQRRDLGKLLRMPKATEALKVYIARRLSQETKREVKPESVDIILVLTFLIEHFDELMKIIQALIDAFSMYGVPIDGLCEANLRAPPDVSPPLAVLAA